MGDERYIPRLYGRRQDKPLKPRQQRALETVLPRAAMPDPAEGPIDLHALFPGTDDIWLEVGFGAGEHLAWQAAHHRTIGMIGAEPFINGAAKLALRIEEDGLENVRIHFGDARPLMEALPDASLGRLFVLFPDPWPKTRHWKRRIVSPWFLREAARLLRPAGEGRQIKKFGEGRQIKKPAGELRIASDIPDYVRWTLMHARGAPELAWTAMRAADWKVRPADWPETRYEAKARREGRTPAYLVFRRQ
jgi:tRNA (guanine-N7-)-methyltransferase